MIRLTRAGRLAGCALAIILTTGTGCGYITDKDRIVIAKLKGENITRGDLDRVIRQLPNDEKPRIETKRDLIRELEKHLDDRIKSTLAKELKAAGKIHVPREIAEQIFLARNPEWRVEISNPEDFGSGLNVRAMAEERESQIDKTQDELLEEAAVQYRIREALQLGTLTATKEELEEEYRLRQDELKTLETVTFEGIWFDHEAENANQEAAQTRQRLDQGESFASIASAFPPDRIIRATVPNDPRAAKFRAFWIQASGSKAGDNFGPVVIANPEMTLQGADGQMASKQLPIIFLVGKIVDSKPPRPKTFEEATPDLEPSIFYGKMMESLYREFGREVFEDKMADPSIYGAPRNSQMPAGPRKPAAPASPAG